VLEFARGFVMVLVTVLADGSYNVSAFRNVERSLQ